MSKSSSVLRKIIVPAAAVLCLLLMAAVVFKYAEEIVSFKERLYDRREASGDEELARIAEYTIDHALVDARRFRGDEWFIDAPLIYHACGGIDGLDYSNSREALEKTLAMTGGRAIVEVDFAFTADGRLVCVHEWSNLDAAAPLSYDAVMQYRIYGKYTPLSAADVLDYMARYPNLYIVVDTKDMLPDVMRALVDLADSPALLDRLIIQLYHAGEKAQIQALHRFPEENFLYTVYKTGNYPDYVLSLCQEENISVVTLPYQFFSEDWQVFVDKGFVLYAHTVNRPDYARALRASGVSGLYTDFLTASDLAPAA